MVSEQHAVLCEGLSIAVSRLFETDSVWACSLLHLLCGIYEMTSRDMLQLQRFSHHARRVVVQPVQVGLLAQEPRRRTRPRSLALQHFLHYFSEEVPRGKQ